MCGGGPSPAALTAPGTSVRSVPFCTARSSSGTAASPSPLITQSIAPAACISRSSATKLALWPPTNTKQSGRSRLDCLGGVDDLGHIGQVIAAHAHRVRLPLLDQPPQSSGRFHLQVDDAHVVSGRARRAGDQFKAERFQSQKDAGVHQPAWVEGQQLHAKLRKLICLAPIFSTEMTLRSGLGQTARPRSASAYLSAPASHWPDASRTNARDPVRLHEFLVIFFCSNVEIGRKRHRCRWNGCISDRRAVHRHMV